MFKPRALSHSDESSARRLVYLRLVVSTLMVGAAIMVLQMEDRAVSVAVMYGLLGVIYLSAGAIYLTFRLGVQLDRACISKIENGSRRVYDFELKAIAKVMETSSAWLIGESKQ